MLLAGYIAWRFFSWPDALPAVAFTDGELHAIARAVDGDTLELVGGDRIRLIGVDCPEFGDSQPEPFAVQAREFAQRLTAGETARLEFDRERLDRYHRVLAWVYVDGELLNESLVRAGLARVMTQYDYSTRMKKRLLAAEREARQAGVGLWRRRR